MLQREESNRVTVASSELDDKVKSRPVLDASCSARDQRGAADWQNRKREAKPLTPARHFATRIPTRRPGEKRWVYGASQQKIDCLRTSVKLI